MCEVYMYFKTWNNSSPRMNIFIYLFVHLLKTYLKTKTLACTDKRV